MSEYKLKSDHASKKEGSQKPFYPLINKKRKVQEFVEQVALEILENVNDLNHAYGKGKDHSNNKVNDHMGTTRYYLDGWRPLTEDEYAEWKETGRSILIGETPTPTRADSSVELADMKAELEALKRQNEHLQKMAIGDKVPTPKRERVKAEIELPVTEGGIE